MSRTVTQPPGRAALVLAPLAAARDAIVACDRCPRLRHYCERIGRVKRRAYSHDVYWARPVPGFGDPAARVLIVGLAPAAHGANRTGRVFTGDGVGGSGDVLMAALHATGFANLPTSQRADDGLALTDAFITCAVRCAPPDNTPAADEVAACRPHLAAELAALTQVRAVVTLGALAHHAYLRHLADTDLRPRPAPRFGHGVATRLPHGILLVGCYHPSRQNTNTGRLTAAMMTDVFARVRRAIAR